MNQTETQQPIRIKFRTRNEKQVDAVAAWLDPNIEQLLYGGGKGGGKSYLGASLIFGDALTYPETHYFIARKELNDLRKYTTPTIHEVFKNWGIKFDDYCSYNGQDNCFILSNGSKVFFISCNELPSDPLFERFGSMQMTRGWIEEGGEIAEAAKSNLWLSIGRWKNDEYGLKKKLLITANPKKNWMKREFIDPNVAGTLDPTKKFISALVRDNPYLPTDYVNTLRNEKDAVRRSRLFEGNWDYDDDADALLDSKSIADMFRKQPEKEGEKFITIDPAFQGKDLAVMYIWTGYSVIKKIKMEKTDHETLMQMIDLYANAYEVPRRNIITDAVGNAEYLPTMMKGIRGFVGGSMPLPDKKAKVKEMEKPFFANLRTQCIYEMALLIKLGKISIPNDDEEFKQKLIEELEQWKVKEIDEDRKLAIISKADIKEIIGRSTDYSDALYMRAFFDLDTERSGMTIEKSRKQEEENKRQLAQKFNKWGL